MTITIPSEKVKLRKLSDLKGDGKFCSERLPLVHIEPDKIIPDELHLMLRITDVLIDAIINTVTAYDLQQHHELQQAVSSRSCNNLNVLEGQMLNKLIAVINSCGVQFRIWKEGNNGALNWTSLMGPDKLRLLEKLPDKLKFCHPVAMVSDVQALWKVLPNCIAYICIPTFYCFVGLRRNLPDPYIKFTFSYP